MSTNETRPEIPSIAEESDAVEFVETIQNTPHVCTWCWKPLIPAPIVQLPGETEATPLATGYDDAVEDYPPHKRDSKGNVTEYVRSEQLICDECGELDPDPGRTRGKDPMGDALTHLCRILEANGMDVDQSEGEFVLAQAFANRRVGKPCQVLGEALFASVSDS